MKKIIASIVLVCLLYFLVPPYTASYASNSAILPSVEDYAKNAIINAFGEDQWPFFKDLVNRESKWDSDAKNPKSSAYGLCQFLDGTWKDTGIKKTGNPYKQIDACIKYVSPRYSYPQKAIVWHNKWNWF